MFFHITSSNKHIYSSLTTQTKMLICNYVVSEVNLSFSLLDCCVSAPTVLPVVAGQHRVYDRHQTGTRLEAAGF